MNYSCNRNKETGPLIKSCFKHQYACIIMTVHDETVLTDATFTTEPTCTSFWVNERAPPRERFEGVHFPILRPVGGSLAPWFVISWDNGYTACQRLVKQSRSLLSQCQTWGAQAFSTRPVSHLNKTNTDNKGQAKQGNLFLCHGKCLNVIGDK